MESATTENADVMSASSAMIATRTSVLATAAITALATLKLESAFATKALTASFAKSKNARMTAPVMAAVSTEGVYAI